MIYRKRSATQCFCADGVAAKLGEGAAASEFERGHRVDRSGFDRLDDERRLSTRSRSAQLWRQRRPREDYKSLPWTPKFSDGIEADFLAFSAGQTVTAMPADRCGRLVS